MLVRLSILFVQGEAVRHPQELAKRGPIRLDTPAFAQNTKYSYRKTWCLAQRRQSIFLPFRGSPGRTIRCLGANNPTPGLRKTLTAPASRRGCARLVSGLVLSGPPPLVGKRAQAPPKRFEIN
mgnify:CR=1 FL=1